MATLIEKEPTTKRASAQKAARVRSLNRLRGKVARRSAKSLWWEGYRWCDYCDQAIADPSQAAMYRAPADAERGKYFILADNSRAVIGHKSCPESEGTLPVPRSETAGCWPCRDCGARVPELVNTCLFCGYERHKCESCHGTGSIDVGSLIGGEMPCGCDNGFEYPVPAGRCLGGCGAHTNDAAEEYCGACEAGRSGL